MIIFVQINYSQDHSEKILPLGILSAGSALKRAGFEVELITLTEKEIDSAAKEIAKKNPLCVGISVMTGIQTKHSVDLSKKIKALANIPILWGGIHPSLCPEQCMSEEYIDFIIIGEAEETIIEFAQRLAGKKSLGGVLGLGHKKNKKIIIEPRRPLIKDLNQWRLDFGLLDINKFVYKQAGYERVLAYKASRGCPFRCTFCYNLLFNYSRWRTWSPEVVLQDINFLKEKYKIDAVKFYDDNFFVDKKWALEILEKIKLPAHVEIRIDAIDDELAKALKKYRCFDMLIGVESGSDRILKLISKNFNVKRTLESVRVLAKYDLPASYSTILGLPTETEEEFFQTIDLMRQIYKIHPKANFTCGAYLPYPGSAMYDLALREGFKPPQKTEGWGEIDRFRKDFKSPWVDGKKVWRIRQYFKFLGYHLGPLTKWFEFRIKHRFFSAPIDIYLVEFLAGLAIEEKTIFGRFLRKTHNFFKKNKYA